MLSCRCVVLFLTQIFMLSVLSNLMLVPFGNAAPKSVHGPFTDGELLMGTPVPVENR
jgi:hypothetical protein